MEIKEKTLSSKNFFPASLKQSQIPNSPGIYKFFANDELIYIGKAKDLRKRVSSYFHNSVKDRKTNQKWMNRSLTVMESRKNSVGS